MHFIYELLTRKKLSRNARRFSERRVRPKLETLEDRIVLNAAVPGWESLPGAPVTLYLDFDGHEEPIWGSTTVHNDVLTPKWDLYDADDQQHNPNDFDAQEMAMMHEIYQHVAEDFAPFKINVTTIAPPASAFANQSALRVAIGGASDDWYTQPGEEAVGGIAVVGSFNDPNHANTVYVFTENLDKTAKRIGKAASHEAGHAIGLSHQSEWDGDDLLNEYHPGNAKVSPIMGNYTDPNVERTIWWTGTNANQTLQNDFNSLYINLQSSGSFSQSNAPFRPDDYANGMHFTIPFQGEFTAQGLISPYAISANGTMNQNQPDVDYFAVSLGNPYVPGKWEVSVNVADVGPNLDARIEVYDSNGNFITAADPTNSLDATVKLSGGVYWIAVMGHNRVGHLDPETYYLDAGTYTISTSFSAEKFDYRDGPAPELPIFVCDPLGPIMRDPHMSELPIDGYCMPESLPISEFDGFELVVADTNERKERLAARQDAVTAVFAKDSDVKNDLDTGNAKASRYEPVDGQELDRVLADQMDCGYADLRSCSDISL